MKIRTDATGRRVTPSEKAIKTYRREGRSLVRRYRREAGRDMTLREIVTSFVARDGEYAPGTISVFRGGVRQLIADAHAAGFVALDEANHLDALAGTGPRPMLTGPARTSGKKVTTLRAGELQKLMRFLIASPHELDKFLALYACFALQFFCRPIEWSAAVMTEASLTILNAKATNGRAHGTTRMFLLDRMTEEQKLGLQSFLTDFARWADHYGGYEKFQKVYARRLTRASRLAGIRALSPTTFRHCGMAIAKAVAGVAEVAYLAGHQSLATAGRHYAKRRSALPGLSLVVRAPADVVGGIQFSGSATHRQKITLAIPASK